MKLIHSILPQKETIWQFSRFIVVGVLNTAISLAAFYLLYNLFSVNYTIANLISYIVGVINSFFWNKHWVFQRGGSHRIVRESIAFLLVFAISYGVQFIFLWGMVEKLGINPNWAQLPAMVIYTVINYILNRYVTFSNKKVL
ncbi:MAG: GtrA family protein [Porphyromonadaceae bacterium]|nr:GtrA family protein [Porphyromonadaceae bacterium]